MLFSQKNLHMIDKTKGYILGTIAAATYGMNPLFALPLYEAGMNPDSVLFFRYLFSLPILAIMLKARGRSFKLNRNEIIPLMVAGLLISLSSLTLFMSYKHMDAGIASTILFVYPVLVALIMVFFFKERLTLQTIICMLVASAGIALLCKGGDGITLSTKGIILVMASALLYAIYIVGINKSSLKNIATSKLTFYVLAFGLILFFVRVDFGQSLQFTDKWYLWGNLIALALFPTVISFLCTTMAVQYIGSTQTAILGALEPVTALFFGITIFGETLTNRGILGIVMIIIAVSFIVSESSMKTYLVRLRKLFPKLPMKKKVS